MGWMGGSGFYRITTDDVVRGFPLGHEGPVPPPRTRPVPEPRRALEAAIRRALQRPPCVVAFSGGRDSSAVLAVATTVARREGLPEPIPVTRVFADAPETEETEWQELVVRSLGLDEWERIPIDDELDLLGDLATRRLLAHGVLWPPLMHCDIPMLERARGGSLVDGEGGDELFDPSHRIFPLARLLRRDARVSRPALKRVAGALGPYPAVLRRVRRRNARLWPWLRPEALEEAVRAMAAADAARPRTYRRSALVVPTRRTHRSLTRNRAVFAREVDVNLSSPFLDADVVHGVARLGGIFGFASRTEAMRHLFHDLLPDEVLARRTKAAFNGGVVRDGTRAFVEAWDGSGVDESLVDAPRLREAWRRPSVSALSWTLLQTAWLAGQRSQRAPARTGVP